MVLLQRTLKQRGGFLRSAVFEPVRHIMKIGGMVTVVIEHIGQHGNLLLGAHCTGLPVMMFLMMSHTLPPQTIAAIAAIQIYHTYLLS